RTRARGRTPVATAVPRTPRRAADRRARHPPPAVRAPAAHPDPPAGDPGGDGGRLRQPASLQRLLPPGLRDGAARTAAAAGSRRRRGRDPAPELPPAVRLRRHPRLSAPARPARGRARRRRGLRPGLRRRGRHRLVPGQPLATPRRRRWPRAEAGTARLPTVADAGDGGAGAAHVRPRRRSPGDRRRALARRGIAAAAEPAPGPAPARRLGRVRDRGTRGARPAGERGRRAYPRRAPGPPPRDAVAAGAGGLRPAMPVPGAGADRHSGPVGPRRARGARTHDPRDRTRPARRPGRLQRRAHAGGLRRTLDLPARHRPLDRALHRPARARPSGCVPGRGPRAAAAAARRRRLSSLPARAAALEGRAEGWRPWRAYAVVHAWREAALAPAQPPSRRAPPTRRKAA